MTKKDKKSFFSGTMLALIITIALLAMIFFYMTQTDKPARESIFAKILDPISLFVQRGSEGSLYAKGNSQKLLQLPPDVTTDPLYGFPFDQNFKTCVTSDLGPRNYPPENFHYGIDLRCKNFENPAESPNRPVKSISKGIVVAKVEVNPDGSFKRESYIAGLDKGRTTEAQERDPKAFGNRVHVCDFANGYCIIYGHLNTINVNVGGIFNTEGADIGTCGTTGDSTAEHLHIQIHAVSFGKNANNVEYSYSKDIPSLKGPVNPAKLLLPRLQCCANAFEDACDPRIVDKEEYEARLNR